MAIIIDEGGAHAEPARLIAERLEMPYVEKRMEDLISLAQEMEACVLATGHNLDDEATDVFISYLRGDMDRLLGQRPEIREEGRIAWIKPLRRIPEKEVRLYAIKHGLAFSEVVCRDPFRMEAMRLLCDFDSRHPGTKYSLLRGQEKVSRHKSELVRGVAGAKL